jgi:serine/threonine protein kinase
MAVAIDGLWDMRLVHRDIKPENILLDTEGQAVLIDLTIAKHVDRTTLTRYGRTFGTPGYMSPEHARGRGALTQKSDIFALGVVLAESLTGNHPFALTQDRIGSAAPLGLDEISALDDELGTLVEGMLQVSPVRRPSAREVLGVLSQVSVRG